MLKNLTFFFIFLWINLCLTAVYANSITYSIKVNIDPQNKILQGKAEITPQHSLSIDISGLEKVKLNGRPVQQTASALLQLAAGQKHLIQYQYPLNSYSAYSDNENVVLSGSWYPQINQLAHYQLTVTLPTGFQAISEANKIESRAIDAQHIEYHFNFPHVLDHLSLSASKNYQSKFIDYQGIRIETWFMPANAHLMDQYLQHSADYLKLYQELLGAYPYQRFAIVESPLPSGHSMPTYTLLGSRVIALPFILKTSLGHEILHQWFGNSVYVDRQHGNWCEGLTNYLADYYYAEQQGQGKEYRKGMLRQYAAYANSENTFPVRKFTSRTDKISSVIGYSKVAMIFHQLRQHYGNDNFLHALQKFITANQFRKASWHDLQKQFEAINGQPMYDDFQAWLTRADIAGIAISQAAELEMAQGKLWLKFSLQQSRPYHLHLPLTLNFENNKQQTIIVHFTRAQQDFRIELSEAPVSAYLDPDYHLMRELNSMEKVPDLAWLMGRKSILLVVDEDEQDLYQTLVKNLGIKNIDTINPSALSFEQISSHSLIIAGDNNSLLDKLFAKQAQRKIDTDVELQVRRNPYNEDEVIASVTAKDIKQAKLVARKLSHYGKYSHLQFTDGKIQFKQTVNADNGIRLFEKIPTRAVKPSKTQSLDNIVANLNDRRILLIGEQHDRFEHHLNQLQIIKKLKEAGYQVAVGMEMFQQPYQQALDDYLTGKTTESEFLTQSKYFDKWAYDYNLYKPIIDYALKQKLPVLALNIEGNITRQVARKGLYSLDEKQQQQTPDAMNFSDWSYREDLKSVFQAHEGMLHSQAMNFNYFLQSQVLWDESMAQAAAQFLQQHPQHILVILAGNGHLRYRYGIPQRLQRLSGLSPLVIVQDDELGDTIADYVLLTTPLKGQLTPVMGIYPDKKATDKVIIDGVKDASVAARAGLKKGDIISKLDNKPLKSFTDLKLSLLYADTSKKVSIKIKRGDSILDKYLDFSPSAAKGHDDNYHHTDTPHSYTR